MVLCNCDGDLISIVAALNSLSVVEKVERWTTDTAGLVEKAKNINWIPPVNFNRQIPAVFVCYIKGTENLGLERKLSHLKTSML